MSFGRGKFTDEEELAINQALQKKLGPNYISQVWRKSFLSFEMAGSLDFEN